VRLRSSPPLLPLGVALLALATLSSHAAEAPPPARTAGVEVELPAGSEPTTEEIDAALAKVKADPNFATERKVKTLRWADEEKKRKRSRPGWFDWLADFFAFIGQSARVLVWLLIAIAAGLIVIYVVRLLSRMDGMGGRGPKFVAPSHVQDLDIRPESLPPDIGAAVRELWDRGEHRAALALLYRGLLSRLVHVYEVPIRDSSTEGDCLVLAARHVDEARTRYAQRLVRVWQRAVYGGETIESETVHALCDEFAPTLDREPEPTLGAARGAPA
jgi:uncharacterized protein DUF4129